MIMRANHVHSHFAGEGARATFSIRALLCLVDLRRRQSLGGQHRGFPILGILVAGRILVDLTFGIRDHSFRGRPAAKRLGMA